MGDIWTIPSKGGKAERLTFDNHFGGGPVWTPDGKYIVFSSQRGGSKTLWKIRPGGTPESVLNSPGEDTNPEIAPDGVRLIYTRTRNWWVLTLKDGLSGQTRELQETLTDMFFPTYSPQGDKIAFFATTNGGDIQIFSIRTDGKELTQVTHGKDERNVFPRWSADGSLFYFYQVRPTRSFRRISAGGGTSSEEIANRWEWRTHNAARVDPAGKRVIFTRQENHKATTIVRDIETKRETVFEPTLGEVQWSRDGKFVVGFEITPATPWRKGFGDILVCPMDGGNCRKLAGSGFGPIWSGDELTIYFARWTARDGMEIWSVSANGEGEKRIVELKAVDPLATFFDVSRTGEVVYVQLKPGKHELWMMDFN
jgi:Tol biopolymer transport system component